MIRLEIITGRPINRPCLAEIVERLNWRQRRADRETAIRVAAEAAVLADRILLQVEAERQVVVEAELIADRHELDLRAAALADVGNRQSMILARGIALGRQLERMDNHPAATSAPATRPQEGGTQ